MDMSNFRDKEFDIVFLNSAIEHLFNFENQRKMASEIRRVGKYYFVQTPNRYFPVEPHFLLPFFQFLPPNLKYWILTKTRLSRGKKWRIQKSKGYIEEIRLLTINEMRELFPSCKIYKEKFVGLNKSFTAHNFN